MGDHGAGRSPHVPGPDAADAADLHLVATGVHGRVVLVDPLVTQVLICVRFFIIGKSGVFLDVRSAPPCRRMTTDWEKCLFRMKGGGRERRINNLRSAVNPPVSLL